MSPPHTLRIGRRLVPAISARRVCPNGGRRPSHGSRHMAPRVRGPPPRAPPLSAKEPREDRTDPSTECAPRRSVATTEPDAQRWIHTERPPRGRPRPPIDPQQQHGNSVVDVQASDRGDLVQTPLPRAPRTGRCTATAGDAHCTVEPRRSFVPAPDGFRQVPPTPTAHRRRSTRRRPW